MRHHKMLRFAVAAVPVLVAVLVAPQAESAPHAGRPAGCDAARSGTLHYAGGKRIYANRRPVPCLTYTFADYGEANIVQSANGTLLHGGVYAAGSDPAIPSGGLAISSNLGARWRNLQLPGRASPPESYRAPGDPQLWVDPLTNRIYYTTIGGAEAVPAALCQTDLSYSDDNGKTWVNNPDPALWGCPAFDFPRPFTGPPTTAGDKATLARAVAKQPKAYRNVLYVCKSSHLSPGRQCWKSLDGGATFVEIGGSPANDTAGDMGAWTADVRGIIYGADSDHLNVSRDEGATWTQTPLPAAFVSSSPLGGVRPSVDSRGNVYIASLIDGLPKVAYLRAPWNPARPHWVGPYMVAMPGTGNGSPGVRHANELALAVGAPGHIALAYVGNGDTSDAPDAPEGYHEGSAHHGYLTTSDNLFAAKPVFASVQVDSNSNPLLPWGFPAAANTSISPSRADYVGVTIGPKGQAWAVFFRDNCQAPADCRGSTSPAAYATDFWTNWSGAVATMSFQRR